MLKGRSASVDGIRFAPNFMGQRRMAPINYGTPTP